MARRFATNDEQIPVTVTNADVELFAAPTNPEEGRDVFLQNSHATGIVYINLSGAAVATGRGMIVVQPGGYFFRSDINNAVNVIGSIASNTLCSAFEGEWRDKS